MPDLEIFTPEPAETPPNPPKQSKKRKVKARARLNKGEKRPETRELADDKFFEYVAARPDKSNADVTVYRVDPKCNNLLIGEPKEIAKLPAADFSRAWLEHKHGWGFYDVYFNDGSDRAAYCKGKIDLRTIELYDLMMTPGKCRIDLRTVVEGWQKNDDHIRGWKAAGMWRDQVQGAAEVAETNNAIAGLTSIVSDVIKAQLNGGKPVDIVGLIAAVTPLVTTFLENRTPPAPAIPAGMVSQQDVQQLLDRQRAEFEHKSMLDELRREIGSLKETIAKPAVPGQPSSVDELMKEWQQQLFKEMSRRFRQRYRDDDDDSEGLMEAAGAWLKQNALPMLSQLLQRGPQASAAAVPPVTMPGAAPAIATPTPPPAAQANPAAAGQDRDVLLLRGVLERFLKGRSAASVAYWLVEEMDAEAFYEELKEPGKLQEMVNLMGVPQVQQEIPEAAAVVPQREKFVDWAQKVLAEIEFEDDEVETPKGETAAA